MSLSHALLKGVNDVIQTYIKLVSKKYNIDENELLLLWDKNEPIQTSAQTSAQTSSNLTTIDMNDISIERLHKANKSELVALCKSKGFKCTGTKDVLIGRLMGKEKDEIKDSSKEVNKDSSKEVNKDSSKKNNKSDIINKLIANIPCIPVRRNAHGNLEHPESGLVFDKKTQTVIGKQQDDGSVSELTDVDIEECKRFKFTYRLPVNLEKRDNLDNVKIEELESDIEEDIEKEADEEEIEHSDEDVEIEVDESETE